MLPPVDFLRAGPHPPLNPVIARLNPCGFATLDAQNPGLRYQWSTGDTTRTIRVDQSRLYWVRVISPCGVSTDSIRVTIQVRDQIDSLMVIRPNPCQAPILDAQNEGAQYRWSTGDTTQRIQAREAGLYTVDLTTPCGTSRLQYRYVPPPVHPDPMLTVIGDTCGGPIQLTYAPTPPDALFLWSTGAQGPTTHVISSGRVKVTAVSPPCFRRQDSVQVRVIAPGQLGPGGIPLCLDSALVIPNVVTPGPSNGDGLNDRLRIPTLWAYPGHRLQIYTRHGRLALDQAPYRGQWPGPDAPAGTYYYRLQIPERQLNLKGWIEVVR